VHFVGLFLSLGTYLPMKMEQTECSETSAYKIQAPGNHPKEIIQQERYCLVNVSTHKVCFEVLQPYKP